MRENPTGIELVRFDLTVHGGLPRLSPEEATQAKRIANPLLRNRYERTRSLLRTVLAARLCVKQTDIIFENSDRGKPKIVAPSVGLEFSISHSGDILLVATGEIAVGVDVETRRARLNVVALAERFFSPQDFLILRGMETAAREDQFLRQWVAKEAALKATGTGLGDELRSATCEYRAGKIFAVHCGAGRIRVTPFEFANDAAGAVAWLGGDEISHRWRDPAEFGA